MYQSGKSKQQPTTRVGKVGIKTTFHKRTVSDKVQQILELLYLVQFRLSDVGSV